MQKKANTTQAELSQSQTSVDQTNNNDYSEHNEPIEGTPFYIRGNKTVGYILTMGDYKLTEFLPTPEDVVEQLETEKWLIIVRMIAGAMDADEKRKQNLRVKSETE